MSKFGDSRWAKEDFSQGFREAADNFLPDRYKLIGIAASFCEHFLAGRKTNRVLDLGCGDGLLVHELMKEDDRIEATLVDGSPEMLDAARERLAGFKGVRFVSAAFQDLLANDLLEGPFDFIVSSFAIHHLRTDEKEALFGYVYSLLTPGGLFTNIDVVAAPTAKLEDWYLRMWADWIDANADASEKEKYLKTPEVYKDNPDNHPDTLSAQLGALENAGFVDVDCYHKFGIFAMFGGIKDL